MKKKRIKRALVIPLILIIIILIVAVCLLRGKTFHADKLDVGDDSDRVVTAAISEVDVSFGSAGFFYADGNVIRYYDPETKSSYVLCGKANCLHVNTSCNAYFQTSWGGAALDNVAQYGDYVYCTGYNADTNTVDLFQIDPVNDTRKSVVSFDAGVLTAEYEEEIWVVQKISPGVYYAGGYAWMDIGWQLLGNSRNLRATQLCGVDLSTGEIIYFNEREDWGEWLYSWQVIDANYVVYTKERYTTALVDEFDYYDQYGDTEGPVTIDGVTYDSYSDYYHRYYDETPQEYEFLAYDIQNQTTVTLDAGITTEKLGGYGMKITHSIYGIYNGKAIYGKKTLAEDGGVITTLYWMNVETKETELLCELGHGTLLHRAGNADWQAYTGTLTYITNPYGTDPSGKDSGQVDVMTLNLDTGESTYLLTYDYINSFQIWADAPDGYYGKMGNEWVENFCYYWISKEDYESGNFDNLIKYQVDVSWFR